MPPPGGPDFGRFWPIFAFSGIPGVSPGGSKSGSGSPSPDPRSGLPGGRRPPNTRIFFRPGQIFFSHHGNFFLVTEIFFCHGNFFLPSRNFFSRHGFFFPSRKFFFTFTEFFFSSRIFFSDNVITVVTEIFFYLHGFFFPSRDGDTLPVGKFFMGRWGSPLELSLAGATSVMGFGTKPVAQVAGPLDPPHPTSGCRSSSFGDRVADEIGWSM